MEYTTKILIADENSAGRALIKECFLRAGCRYIEEAVNGEDALSKIGRIHPDVVIIDIWMSKVDGLSVVRSAKALPYGNDKPPVIITKIFHRNLPFITKKANGMSIRSLFCIILSKIRI